MQTKRKKRVYKGRNTGLLYGRLSQLPEYNYKYREVIKEGAINELYEKLYGKNHRKSLHVSDMTDRDYQLLLNDLDEKIRSSKTSNDFISDNVRKHIIHKIFNQFKRMGIDVSGNYEAVNIHIKKLSGGRIIPEIPTTELDKLHRAVCSYCDYFVKKQKEERKLTLKN